MKQSTLIVLSSSVAGIAMPALAQVQGPSTLQTPYVVPVAPGVQTVSIASNGNGIQTPNETFRRGSLAGPNDYRMVGIPDGLGAFDNGDGSFTLLMNHELGAADGIVRAHGTTGAFVSKWNINKNTLAVNFASDLITSVAPVPGGSAPFGRLCSADLPLQSAYFNPSSGLGTQQRIYMNGEEVGNEGRGFGHVVSTGTSYYLPHLGKFSWENGLANPFAQDKTVFIGTDDSTPGEVYMYVGTKRLTGNEVEKAGLVGGNLYGTQVAGATSEFVSNGIGGISANFTMHNFGDVSARTGAQLQTDSTTASVMKFARPEDGVWDPNNPRDFYFVTTGATLSGDTEPNRLYRMRFNSITNPEAGGVIEMLLDGTEGMVTMDNMTLVSGTDGHTRLLIQEDPGGAERLAKIWMYDVGGDSLLEVATHDATRFATGGANFLTTNEESSGIIPAWDILGPGWFLLDVQAHYPIAGELVEGGQLLAMNIPQTVPEPASLSVLAAGALLGLRRRR